MEFMHQGPYGGRLGRTPWIGQMQPPPPQPSPQPAPAPTTIVVPAPAPVVTVPPAPTYVTPAPYTFPWAPVLVVGGIALIIGLTVASSR